MPPHLSGFGHHLKNTRSEVTSSIKAYGPWFVQEVRGFAFMTTPHNQTINNN